MNSDKLYFWKEYWEKHRIRISQLGGLVLLLFSRPTSNLLFILGFLTALAGQMIRIWAAGHIRKGHALAQQGPYALTRNPLYFGSFVMACGFALICTSPRHHFFSTLLIWSAVLSTFYWLYPKKIEIEEEDLGRTYGAEFKEYCRRAPRFWPDRNNWGEAWLTTEWNFHQVLRNKEHKTFWAVLGLALLLRFKLVYRI